MDKPALLLNHTDIFLASGFLQAEKASIYVEERYIVRLLINSSEKTGL